MTNLFDLTGNITQTVDEDGHWLQNVYDVMNRLTAMFDETGDETDTAYDAVGNVTQTIDPEAAVKVCAKNGFKFETEMHTSVRGAAPHRVYVVQWQNNFFGFAGSISYQVQLFEGENRLVVLYGPLSNPFTSDASVGIQSGGPQYTAWACGDPPVASGLELTFRELKCDEPTYTPTATYTATPAPTSSTPPRLRRTGTTSGYGGQAAPPLGRPLSACVCRLQTCRP